MRLHLVTGFLGSGKTTFIVKLAAAAIARGQRVAVIVNEVGEVGIDGQLMKQLEMDVWELSSGCICCSLSSDLISVLHKLDEHYQTDIVIVEPSGVAEPGKILSALPYYKGREIESISSTCIVDVKRIEELYEVLSPLITDQISRSQRIVISKMDIAEPQELKKAKAIINTINPQANLYEWDNSQELLEQLLT